MSAFGDLLSSRSSFVLAALVVTWFAVVLLALIAANLHLRLGRLERSAPAAEPATPFGHLLGRSLAEALGPHVSPAVRLALVLSADCPSCARILAGLDAAGDAAGVVLLWRDATPAPPPPLPPGASILDDGSRVSRELGVNVTPFALRADASGRIVRATPIASVEVLEELLADAGFGQPPDWSTASLLHHPPKGVS